MDIGTRRSSTSTCSFLEAHRLSVSGSGLVEASMGARRRGRVALAGTTTGCRRPAVSATGLRYCERRPRGEVNAPGAASGGYCGKAGPGNAPAY
jgi:hypothetical protein